MNKADERRAIALLDELNATLPRRDRNRVNIIVAALISLPVTLGPRWKSLAMVAAHHGEWSLARAAMARWVADQKSAPAARFEQAVLTAQGGRLVEAGAMAATVPADIPTPAAYAFFRGSNALNLGQRDDARHWFEKAVEAEPLTGSAWLGLATLGNMADDPLADRLLATRGAERAPPAEAAAWCHAAGKVLADRGDHDAAFAAFARGAAIAAQAARYDADADRRSAAEASAFTANDVAAPSGRNGRGIIVTGLPRSGTTLVEQILASHSEVADGGEVNLLRLLAQDVGGLSAAAIGGHAERSGGLESLAALYDHLLAERFGPHGRLVDKTLDTSRFLGIVAAAMPDVPVIWMRRSPLDNAWSCFHTLFVGGVSWSTDLKAIAAHFRLEDALWRHWSAILGERLLTVPYEALVEQPAEWIRRILRHCRLVEEPAVFTPHLTRRAVTTSSVAQVRRPINRDGIGAAEPYRRHLQPFIDAYRET